MKAGWVDGKVNGGKNSEPVRKSPLGKSLNMRDSVFTKTTFKIALLFNVQLLGWSVTQNPRELWQTVKILTTLACIAWNRPRKTEAHPSMFMSECSIPYCVTAKVVFYLSCRSQERRHTLDIVRPVSSRILDKPPFVQAERPTVDKVVCLIKLDVLL